MYIMQCQILHVWDKLNLNFLGTFEMDGTEMLAARGLHELSMSVSLKTLTRLGYPRVQEL